MATTTLNATLRGSLVLLVLGLAGCASTLKPGDWVLISPWQGAERLTECVPAARRNPDVYRTPVPDCQAVITDNPSDEEAWMFEARLRVISRSGIPYGRAPQDFLVVGTRARCEGIRTALRSKPHPFYAQETPPTDPCQGPYYFRRQRPA